ELRAYAAAAVSANARPASRSMAAMGTNVPQVLEASGADEFKASRLAAILLHCLGVEGQRQYNVVATSRPPQQQPTTEAEGKSATADVTEESKPASGDTTDEFTTMLKLVRR
ncbi:unnamed protein product, partial [Ixodes pacificus]